MPEYANGGAGSLRTDLTMVVVAWLIRPGGTQYPRRLGCIGNAPCLSCCALAPDAAPINRRSGKPAPTQRQRHRCPDRRGSYRPVLRVSTPFTAPQTLAAPRRLCRARQRWSSPIAGLTAGTLMADRDDAPNHQRNEQGRGRARLEPSVIRTADARSALHQAGLPTQPHRCAPAPEGPRRQGQDGGTWNIGESHDGLLVAWRRLPAH